MKNCKNCNNEDVCGGNFISVVPCPDFVTKKVKINHPRININRCGVCGKEIKVNAKLCSGCRKPYESIKAKFPHLVFNELLKLTKLSIIESKKRLIERRKLARQ